MCDNQDYNIQGLDEYIRQGEPLKRERGDAWRVAIGLQQVDGLTTSEYLLDTARKHIDGEINISQARALIDSYYMSAAGRKDVENARQEEADKVSARIAEILGQHTFSFSPSQLLAIHRHLFTGIYSHAGTFRNYNITKAEWVLGGKTLYYASADAIISTLDYDMTQERAFSYNGMGINEAIAHIARFCANIWQIHPFGEGNTRTTAVFIIKYLRTLGFEVKNDAFASHSWYFRNALVRANYSDIPQGITETTTYLQQFFRAMLLGENYDFRNRTLHIHWEGQAPQSATSPSQSAKMLPPKCKNCTLDEIALLGIVQKCPSITQKEIARELGKSERTVKSITVHLQEIGVLRRAGGRRSGHWEVVE